MTTFKLSDGTTIGEACAFLAENDQGLKILYSQFGPPELKPNASYYQALVRSIIFQQLNGKAAQTILDRFLLLFPGQTFPVPETLADADVILLRQAGLSQRKAEYVIGIAEVFSDSTFLKEDISQMTDVDVSEKLTSIRGIGQWTADMFLIFTLLRPDVLPLNDLGIKKGMQIFFKLSEMPDADEMIELSSHWKPFRSAACWYMWKVVDEDWNWPETDD